MHVHVRHLEPGDHQADAGGGEQVALRLTDPLRDGHQVGGRVDVEVGPLVDLGAGNDEHVAGRERTDVHERDADVVGVNETAGDLAVDDAGEDGGHERIVGCSA